MTEPDLKFAETLAIRLLSSMKLNFWAARPRGEFGAIVAVLEDSKTIYEWVGRADLLLRLSSANELTFDVWQQATRMAELCDPEKLPVVLIFDSDEGNLRGHATLACLDRPEGLDEPRRKPKGFRRTLPRPKVE